MHENMLRNAGVRAVFLCRRQTHTDEGSFRQEKLIFCRINVNSAAYKINLILSINLVE